MQSALLPNSQTIQVRHLERGEDRQSCRTGAAVEADADQYRLTEPNALIRCACAKKGRGGPGVLGPVSQGQQPTFLWIGRFSTSDLFPPQILNLLHAATVGNVLPCQARRLGRKSCSTVRVQQDMHGLGHTMPKMFFWDIQWASVSYLLRSPSSRPGAHVRGFPSLGNGRGLLRA